VAVTVWVPPDPAGVVMGMEQVPAVRVQLIDEGSRDASLVKVTVPVGTIAVPTSMSVTVAMHMEVWPTVTGLVQVTVVLVARALTVIVFDVLGPLPL
jgi:hypothetical protein